MPKTKADKRRPSTGSVQSLDAVLSAFIERQFRGETPQAIDVYPLLKGRDREMRLYHYDVKANEAVGAERAVELANEIFSVCQLHCDALPAQALYRGTKTFEVTILDDRRGGIAKPVGLQILTLEPRIHRPAPKEGDEQPEGDEALSARKMMLESVKMIHDRDLAERENEGKIVGDTMLVMKGALADRETLIKDLFGEVRGMIGEFRGLAREVAERKVEERAVGIDDLNAAENRRDQAARRDRENMWTDVTRGSIIEGIKVLGQLVPGFGQLFLAQLTGQPPPEPPQLHAPGATPPLAPPPSGGDAPQLPAVPEEKLIIDRFIAGARARKIDDTHTAADKLFGKDDDATGATLEAGVFSREQVAILAGVSSGKVGVEALDALLADSGKPEAIQPMQMVKAIACLTPQMLEDITKFIQLRTARRGKPN